MCAKEAVHMLYIYQCSITNQLYFYHKELPGNTIISIYYPPYYRERDNTQTHSNCIVCLN